MRKIARSRQNVREIARALAPALPPVHHCAVTQPHGSRRWALSGRVLPRPKLRPSRRPRLVARGEAIYLDWEERRMWPEGSVSV